MKRFATLLTAALLVLGSFGAAQALEFKASGDWEFGGGYAKNTGNDAFYTRAGHLLIDENGMVKTEEGLNVIDAGEEPLQLQTTAGQNVAINESGGISIDGEPSGSQILAYFSAALGPRKGRITKCSNGHQIQRLSWTTRWSCRNSAR